MKYRIDYYVKVKQYIGRSLYLPDHVIVVKSITESVTPLKTKARKTLILRVLRFEEVVPPELNSLFIYHRYKFFHFPAYVITLCKLPI